MVSAMVRKPQPMSLNSAICETIKDCRHWLGISESEFAKSLGVPVKFARALERGEIETNKEIFASCARALSLSPTELLEVVMAEYDIYIFEPEKFAPKGDSPSHQLPCPA
jgi:ribosome-binding protein aMBF1 (putative translation factor)